MRTETVCIGFILNLCLFLFNRFQEVVPLNAGNVLGAENRRPIPKWEAIIRRTLNRTPEPETPETKMKSYSAPPSPVLRTSPAADMLADVVETPMLDIIGEEIAVNGLCKSRVTDSAKNLQFNRIYGINCANQLDWPERSLDATPQVLSSRFKLRRVSSSLGRMDTDWTQNPQNLALDCRRLKRMHHSSGNLELMWTDHQDDLNVLNPFSDASDPSSEEEDDFFEELSEVKQDNSLEKGTVKLHPRYVRIVSKQMVGIYVSIWVRRGLRRHVNNLKVSPVGVGLMGYMGNKV